MLPKAAGLLPETIRAESEISLTHRLLAGKKVISGCCDGLNAVRQAAYFILNTERYQWPVYSWNYGLELKDLYGKQIPFVLPELKRRIGDALTRDDRIQRVDSFSFQVEGKRVHTGFTVHSCFGEFEEEWEAEF